MKDALLTVVMLTLTATICAALVVAATAVVVGMVQALCSNI